MLAVLPSRIRALANLKAPVRAGAQTVRARSCTLARLNAKEITK
jgi:hypothetical protein